MKTAAWFSTALLSGALAAPASDTVAAAALAPEIARRALPNAPDGYTPTSVSCPGSRPTIRSAAKLSANETSWLETRRGKTLSAMKDFFGHVQVGSFDVGSYLDKISGNSSNLPNIGIAVSGGGYRAMLNGAGAIKAFDSRTENATTSGHLGGLLQSATYVSGLSGGSWLVGSIFINNFTTISDLQTGQAGAVWQLGNSVFEGPDSGSIQLLDTAGYFKDLADAVEAKKHAGFDTSITDVWGRALAYQMFNASAGGIDYTWSSIGMTPEFQNAEYPMPLVVADGRYPGETVVGGNATVYEFNPWEFGTWDPTIYAFVPLEFLGSRFSGGTLPDNETCVRGYDNAGFIIGSSSTLFNDVITELNTGSLPAFVTDVLTDVFQSVDKADEDIAVYEPSPFYGYNNATSPYAQQTEMDVVDGGEDLQNIPLQPLIQPDRHVDVIFAVDSSADTETVWPNGTSLVATYQRSLNSSGIGNGTAFPAVPDQNTFVNLGLNTRPTFFGCDSSNLTGPAPLVVYIPNYPYSYNSNTSTLQMSYDDSQRDDIILNGYEVATMANSTRDGNWTACVGCAILSRSFERTNTAVPDICTQCFQRYCWDGTVNSTQPAPYEPSASLTLDSAAATFMPAMLATAVAAGVALFAVM
ncbi:uncharacterized protein PFLUO_LOCUS7919 [Penicillium psychrofluorescens]|uniref:uncharacterized protein n=1 Tax=Penicillium psychrofluorescens TaxID=3158075 RepID=UPI003CCE0BCD